MTLRVVPSLRMSEADLTVSVLELCRIFRWRCVHFRPARTAKGWRTPVAGDGAGWPDILAVRGDRMVAAELKAGRNRPSPEQLAWLDALAATGAEIFVWTDQHLDDIAAALR